MMSPDVIKSLKKEDLHKEFKRGTSKESELCLSELIIRLMLIQEEILRKLDEPVKLYRAQGAIKSYQEVLTLLADKV